VSCGAKSKRANELPRDGRCDWQKQRAKYAAACVAAAPVELGFCSSSSRVCFTVARRSVT
jgi:hypothetical protein